MIHALNTSAWISWSCYEPRMTETLDWTPRLTSGDGPLYLRIAAAIEADIASGRLRPGDRLPSQRALAEALGIDMTTVTRAYTEGRRRHVLDAMTGRGSFVAARPDKDAPPLDLAMIQPPRPRGVALGDLIRRGLDEVLLRSDPDLLMSYHPGAGLEVEKAAGAVWLRPIFPEISTERIAVSPGAQTALIALLSQLAAPGDIVLCERLTYPGLIAAARSLRLRLHGIDMDHEGVLPDALENAAGRTGARLACLTPSMQNPTAATMSPGRRASITAILRACDLQLIEDDPYAMLLPVPLPALAAFAPERSWHISTLAKCLTPGLRTAFLVAPDAAAAGEIASTIRAFAQSAAPLMTALAARWIRDGSATALLNGVRAEAEARQSMARRILPAGIATHPCGLHVWLTLPPHLDRAGLIATARAHGLGLMPSDAFAVDPAHAPDAVRLSLGAVADRTRLKSALETLAALMASPA